MALRRRYAEAVQMPFDLRHKRLGAEEVGIQIALLGQPLSQLFKAEQAFGITLIARTRFAVAHVMAQLRTLIDLRLNPVAESVYTGVAGAVDKVDITARVARRFQHAQRRGDADAGSDQHQRLGRLTQYKIPRRGKQLQAVTDLQLVMQVIGDLAADLALDADAVLAAIAQGRQRVVAALLATVQQQAQADVLAGPECRQRATVGRHQVQRDDLLAFLHLAAQAETARPAPATLSSGVGAISSFFGTDKDVRQLPIRHGPGFDHRIGGDLFTKHFTNRPQQAAADNRVMLGQDLQR